MVLEPDVVRDILYSQSSETLWSLLSVFINCSGDRIYVYNYVCEHCTISYELAYVKLFLTKWQYLATHSLIIVLYHLRLFRILVILYFITNSNLIIKASFIKFIPFLQSIKRCGCHRVYFFYNCVLINLNLLCKINLKVFCIGGIFYFLAILYKIKIIYEHDDWNLYNLRSTPFFILVLKVYNEEIGKVFISWDLGSSKDLLSMLLNLWKIS